MEIHRFSLLQFLIHSKSLKIVIRKSQIVNRVSLSKLAKIFLLRDEPDKADNF